MIDPHPPDLALLTHVPGGDRGQPKYIIGCSSWDVLPSH